MPFVYEYKFQEISSEGMVFVKETAIQRTEDWLNKVAKDGWELVSFQHTGTYVIVAVRRMINA